MSENENTPVAETVIKEKPPILYGSRIKDLVKEVQPDFRMGSDALDELETKVRGLVFDAVQRAKANDRKTVGARDF